MSPIRLLQNRAIAAILKVVALLLVFGLAACGIDTARLPPTPTKTVTLVRAQQPLPSPEQATATSLLSTAATQPQAEATLPPTLAAAVQNHILPEGVSPFTGLKVADPAVLKRMPAAVKISNSPIVRPQSGLSKADIVVEHLAEGGITRFTAIYHSEAADRIGSIRSARLIDLEIPALLKSFLVYSGASGEVSRLLESSDLAAYLLSDERKDPGFYRLAIPGRAYEHTLYTDTQLLWQVAQEQGWDRSPEYRGWIWSDEPPEDVEPARVIEIPYSDEYSDVRYEYDPAAGVYQRWILDEPHVEELTGEQLATPNVAVLYVNHVDTLIVEDVLGSTGQEIQLWGRGRMQLFRDGVVKEGIWLRPNRQDPLLFVDGNYEPIPLKPGKLWIQLVPLDAKVTIGE